MSLLCSNPFKAPPFVYSESGIYHHLYTYVTSKALSPLPCIYSDLFTQDCMLVVVHSRCSPASGLLSLCYKTNIHFSLCLNVTF